MFEKPEFFWLFLGIPVFALLLIFDILINKRRSKKIAGENVKLIIPYYTEGQKWIKLVLYITAFCLTILALARPKWGLTTIDSKIKGRDVLILLDVSYSMATNDIIPSRYELAKSNIDDLLKSESGDRIGLMIFSGDSELISPITFDYAAINFFLDSLYPGMLGKGGTNIGKALLNALRSFDDEVVNNKMILLITDGENLHSDFKRALKKVKEYRIKVFTIGVGTKNGQPIPVRDTEGNITTYVKDENGKHVISKLNEQLLRTIADETDGLYLGTITKQNLLTSAMSYINNVEKKEQNTVSFSQKKDRYNIFLIPALILFCLGFILDQGKLFKIKYNRFDWIFTKKSILFILLFSLLIIPKNFYADNNNQDIEYAKQKNNIWIGKPNGGFWGNILFKKNNFKKALESYFGAIYILKDEKLAKLNYNIANTFYKLNDLKNASQYYKNAITLTKDEKLKSKIFYNQALVEFKNQNYSYAAKLFKEVVKIDDQDEDARYNYLICNELKKEAENYYNRYVNQTIEENYNENKEKNKINQDQQLTQQFSNKYIDKLLNALDEKEKKENRERNINKQNQDLQRIKYW